jgi:hypothetical protein
MRCIPTIAQPSPRPRQDRAGISHPQDPRRRRMLGNFSRPSRYPTSGMTTRLVGEKLISATSIRYPDRGLCISYPIDMRPTPVAATAGTVLSVIRPEASGDRLATRKPSAFTLPASQKLTPNGCVVPRLPERPGCQANNRPHSKAVHPAGQIRRHLTRGMAKAASPTEAD